VKINGRWSNLVLGEWVNVNVAGSNPTEYLIAREYGHACSLAAVLEPLDGPRISLFGQSKANEKGRSGESALLSPVFPLRAHLPLGRNNLGLFLELG
jgi:hypothetical protein